MIGSKRNNPDGRHIYYPIAALILTTWHLVDCLCAPEEEEDPVIRPLQGYSDLLTISLPILGSALNGIAKDAGHIWTWYIAQQMQSQGVSADMEDISMLLEVSTHEVRCVTVLIRCAAGHAKHGRRSFGYHSICSSSIVRHTAIPGGQAEVQNRALPAGENSKVPDTRSGINVHV